MKAALAESLQPGTWPQRKNDFMKRGEDAGNAISRGNKMRG